MSNKTRKRFLPVALVMAVVAIGAVAVLIALAGGSPQSVQAHGDSPGSCDSDASRAIHDLLSPDDPCPAPNSAPTAVGSIGAVTVTAGMMSEAKDVSDYFSDPDGDDLTYAATSSDTAVATAGLANADGSPFPPMNWLTITGVAAGDATITVTATDGDDESATQMITVTVEPANTAPAAGAAIADASIGVDGTAMLTSTITDADGDALTWAWSSSDDAIATVMADATDMKMATVTGMANGAATITVTGTDPSGEMATQSAMVTVFTPEADAFSNSSTSGGASVELKLTIGSLPMDAVDGSSVELFLEDDFQVPDSIDRNTVYFTVPGGGDDQNNGGRVYSSYAVEIDDDDHFTANKKDYAIRVFIPDMNDADDSGYDGPMMGQKVNLVFTKAAGIKNPTEAGTHSVGYKVLGPNDEPNKNGRNTPDDPSDDIVQLGTVATKAKISLNDEDAGRGKEITITGTGFNNGTAAEVRVLVSATDLTEGDQAANCELIMRTGEKLGAAPVSSDDKFVVTFTVHQDEFDPGSVNYICAADSEAGAPRGASEVKVFKLEASVTVSPASASFGDEVTLKPRDFTNDISMITFGPSHVWMDSEANESETGCATAYVAGDKRSDGSTIVCMKEEDGGDYVFELPGGLDEQIQIAVTDGKDTKRIYMGVVASGLTLSKSEVAPNESIVISGSGFNRGAEIKVSDITIDDHGLSVDDAGTEGIGANRHVTTTSNGTFTVTARVWAMGDTNPALDHDTYTIKVVDEHGFEGEADITIKEPSIMVSPDTASPRDYIVISGENWPVTTADLDNEVTITIHKGETYQRTRSASVDGNGRFRYEYQLPAGVRIGDDQKIQVRFDGAGKSGNIEEDATFAVTEAELGVTPMAAAPGQTISVNIEGMPPYTLVTHVKIDGANRIGGRNVNTDRDGNATVSDILVPFLDPGFYPVEVKVGDETRVAQLEVLSEALVPGVAATLPDAISDLGDNLEAIFHFNNTSKEWSFFDPRPEFADLNTLTELNSGQPYWVLVGESQADVDWNGRLVNFTCAADDCWNLEIW